MNTIANNDQVAAVMEAEVASEGRAAASNTEQKRPRGRPAGAKNKDKVDPVTGQRIPLKKELAALKPKGKRGRPKGSKNDTSKVETAVVAESTHNETSQDNTILPIGSL